MSEFPRSVSQCAMDNNQWLDGLEKRWVEEHPSIKKAKQELAEAKAAEESVDWHVDAVQFVECVAMLAVKRDEAKRQLSVAYDDARREFKTMTRSMRRAV